MGDVKVVEEFKIKLIKVAREPFTVPAAETRKFIFIKDLDGVWIEIVSRQ